MKLGEKKTTAAVNEEHERDGKNRGEKKLRQPLKRKRDEIVNGIAFESVKKVGTCRATTLNFSYTPVTRSYTHSIGISSR